MWRKDGNDWYRKDGVRVKFDSHFKVPYTVTRAGLTMSMPHNLGRNTQPIRFMSAEKAMEAADQRWPIRNIAAE